MILNSLADESMKRGLSFMAASPKKPGSGEGTSSFTVDHENTGIAEMPSVTRLLNRKKLGLKSTPSPEPPATPPPLPEAITHSEPQNGAPMEIEISADLAPSTANKIKAAIRSTARPAGKGAEKLITWELAILRAGADPLGKALALVLPKPAQSALFLSAEIRKGATAPLFKAKAAVLPEPKRAALWNGLQWDPQSLPELWNAFLKAGIVELPPPGSITIVESVRNGVRGAFGIGPDEHLTLILAGSPKACRGIVILTSKAPLGQSLGEALPLFRQLPAAKAA